MTTRVTPRSDHGPTTHPPTPDRPPTTHAPPPAPRANARDETRLENDPGTTHMTNTGTTTPR